MDPRVHLLDDNSAVFVVISQIILALYVGHDSAAFDVKKSILIHGVKSLWHRLSIQSLCISLQTATVIIEGTADFVRSVYLLGARGIPLVWLQS